MKTTLRVAIVDDEQLALDYLSNLLLSLPDVELVGRFRNGREAVSGIPGSGADLVFLDINMPGIDGFGVVKALQADILPLIVFATAHDKFALKAFELNAVDYILKPFDRGRVEAAIDRGRERALLRRLQAEREEFEGELGELKANTLRAIETMTERTQRKRKAGGVDTDTHHQDADTRASAAQRSDASPRAGLEGNRYVTSAQLGRLPIKDGQQTRLVEFDAIEWIDAAGDYMCVHAAGETYILRSTMKELEQKLTEAFVRIHRSTIVNLGVVDSVDALPKGEALLHLRNGTTLKVSRNFRKAIQHLLA